MGHKNSNLLIAQHASGRMIDIADAQNGLNCNCTCLCCGDRLVAKQGKIKDWHFAHESGAVCAGGLESALHKAAKQIIQEEQSLYVDVHDPIAAIQPRIYDLLYSTNIYLNGVGSSKSHASLFYKFASKELVDKVMQTKSACSISNLTLTNVFTEVKARNSNLIPDITCTLDNKTFYIEIVVTHECDESKLEQLKQLKVPTIEINISELRRINFSMNDVRNALVTNVFLSGARISRQWIVKPRYIQEAEFYAKQFIEVATNKIDEIAKARAKQEAEEAERITKIKAFNTTFVVTKSNYGVRIWIPKVASEIFNEINSFLIEAGAKRRENDWFLRGDDAREVATALINTKDDERLVRVARLEAEKCAAIAIEQKAARAAEIARQDEMRALARKKADELAEKKRQEWLAQEEQEAINLQNELNDAESRREKKKIADAERVQFTEEVCEKYKNTVDHRWRLKQINDELEAKGYPKLSNVY